MACEEYAEVSGWSPGSPAGHYRRRVIIRADKRGAAAAIEDDAHRFEVEIAHDQLRVTAVRVKAVRHPYTTCPGAVPALQCLVGTPLTRDVTAPARALSASLCCTHQFDIVVLAITQSARGPGQRVYDAAVRIDGPTKIATMHRDGEPVLDWAVTDQNVTSDDAAHGRSVRTLLRDLADADPDFVEAVFVMRRALLVAPGRTRPPSAHLEPSQMMGRMAGACHAFQAENAPQGSLIRTHFRDFENAPELLLSGWK